MLTQESKAKIVAECQRYIDLANQVYKPVPLFVLPTISFDLKGKTAGTATFSKWAVAFNPILFAENFEDSIRNTIPHEIAHLIDAYNQRKFPQYGRRRRSIHGPSWKRVMRVFGAKPERCHNYDTTNVENKSKQTKKFKYACNCNKGVIVGLCVHKKIQFRGVSYRTKCCNSRISLAVNFSQVT